MVRSILFLLALSLSLCAEENLKFPKPFLWGVASSEYQGSGSVTCKNANWTEWEKNPEHIRSGGASKKSNRHFNVIQRTINQLKELGCNTYRFSVDWSLVEPREGVVNEAVITHYGRIINHLIKAKIQPVITLYHFSHPKWFENKGGFENEDNIKYFVRFARRIFNRYSDRVKYWITINEPGVYAMHGYFKGTFPPGKATTIFEKGSLNLVAKVTSNLLYAHHAAYAALKNCKRGASCHVGITHQFFQCEVTDDALKEIAQFYELGYHKMIYDCLKTGKFELSHPVWGEAGVRELKPAQKMMDFIGIDYYTSPLITLESALKKQTTCRSENGEYMTDMGYRSYPEGLKKVLKECYQDLGLPILITGCGIPDREDTHRAQWIREHLQAVHQAIQEGVIIKGFCYWTLNDCWEWNEGFSPKFGLYEYNFNTHQPKLRSGAREYMRIIQQNR